MRQCTTGMVCSDVNSDFSFQYCEYLGYNSWEQFEPRVLDFLSVMRQWTTLPLAASRRQVIMIMSFRISFVCFRSTMGADH